MKPIEALGIELQYFPGCPHWQTTARHLSTLIGEGMDARVRYVVIDDHETATERGFNGSPTVLVNGVDPFPGAVGYGCRVYETEEGPRGSPTLEQLRCALDKPGRQ